MRPLPLFALLSLFGGAGSCCPSTACGALADSVFVYVTDASTGQPVNALSQVQLLDGGRWQSYASWQCTDARHERDVSFCASWAAPLLGTVTVSVGAPGYLTQTLAAEPGIVGEGQCGCAGNARTAELRVALQR